MDQCHSACLCRIDLLQSLDKPQGKVQGNWQFAESANVSRQVVNKEAEREVMYLWLFIFHSTSIRNLQVVLHILAQSNPQILASLLSFKLFWFYVLYVSFLQTKWHEEEQGWTFVCIQSKCHQLLQPTSHLRLIEYFQCLSAHRHPPPPPLPSLLCMFPSFFLSPSLPLSLSVYLCGCLRPLALQSRFRPPDFRTQLAESYLYRLLSFLSSFSSSSPLMESTITSSWNMVPEPPRCVWWKAVRWCSSLLLWCQSVCWNRPAAPRHGASCGGKTLCCLPASPLLSPSLIRPLLLIICLHARWEREVHFSTCMPVDRNNLQI